jgi:lysophospholipase L1-like esterase
LLDHATHILVAGFINEPHSHQTDTIGVDITDRRRCNNEAVLDSNERTMSGALCNRNKTFCLLLLLIRSTQASTATEQLQSALHEEHEVMLNVSRAQGNLRPTAKNHRHAKATSGSASKGKIITIGDSYSCGLGIHNDYDEYDEKYGGTVTYKAVTYNFNDSGKCLRDKSTTPGAVLAKAMGKENIMLACTGAEVRHALQQFDYLGALYPTDAANKWKGTIFHMTVGTNDLRAKSGDSPTEIIINCIAELSFTKGCDDFSKQQISNLNTVEDRLVDFYSYLAEKASGATSRVMGYPKPMNRKGICGLVGISGQEADWLDTQMMSVNSITKAVVQKTRELYPSVNIEYVDVLNYFSSGACGNPTTTNDVRGYAFSWKSAVTIASFHPTQKGYDAYCEALADSL